VQIISKIGKIDKLITDGTGFGYDDTYYQSWERGKRLKEVKTHIKTQVIIGTKDDISIPIAVETSISYGDLPKKLCNQSKNFSSPNLTFKICLIS